MKNKLTPKQQLFIREYLVDKNATQAAIRAGYSAKTANETGAENLAKPSIASEIARGLENQINTINMNADAVIREVSRLASYDPRKFFDDDGRIKPISEIDDDTAAAIAGFETVHKIVGDEKDGCVVLTKVKMADKSRNLELMAKILRLYAELKEVTGKDGKDLIPPVTDEELQARLQAIEERINKKG